MKTFGITKLGTLSPKGDVLRKADRNERSKQRIMDNINQTQDKESLTDESDEDTDTNDIVVNEIGTSSEEESASKEDITCVTRSGRTAGTWRHAMYHRRSDTESSDEDPESGDTSDSDNSSSDSHTDGQPESVITRSGRMAGTWRCKRNK